MKHTLLTIFLILPFLSSHAQGKFFGGSEDGYASASLGFTVLPVTGIQFSGESCENKICLHWTTLQEFNTDRFEVERSGSNGFQVLGEQPAAGNSLQLRSYRFDDPHPLPGANYYRLRMVDRDGRSLYSSTLHIRFSPARLIRHLYVNEEKQLRLQLNTTNLPSRIRIFDMNGRQMMTLSSAANNLFQPLPFPAGVYLLLVENGEQIDREKFLVLQ